MQVPGWMQHIVGLVWRPRPRYTSSTASTGAGMAVTIDSALSHATVWACVRYISETIAGLEWQVVKVQDGRREQQNGGAVDWMLNKQANPEMTAVTWRELALTHVLLTGNHYSEIQRDVMGRPLWLWPLLPQAVRLFRDADTNTLKYGVWQEAGGEVILDAKDVFHVKGLTWDGVAGYSVIGIARRSIGIGLAMDEYGANFYKNGTHVGLVFEHPRTMSEKAQENFKRSLDEGYKGPGNSFKRIVIEEGMKLTKATMSMVDAQFLEQRKHNAIDICQWFRVPPHKVGQLERATNNNIEHQSIEAVQDCIQPWCNKLQQEADIKLFGIAAQRSICTELDTSELERGDMKTRWEAMQVARNTGALSVNEVREHMKYNHIGEEGDMRLQPLNMVPLGTEPAEPAEPGEPVEEPAEPGEQEPAAGGDNPPTNSKVLQMVERLQKRKANG